LEKEMEMDKGKIIPEVEQPEARTKFRKFSDYE
jgi:hypothetical protein